MIGAEGLSVCDASVMPTIPCANLNVPVLMIAEKIADMVRDGKIAGISDLRDESDRDGMRIVVELKKDANPKVVLNQLFVHTPLQTTFGAIMLALVDNRPQVLTLRGLLDELKLETVCENAKCPNRMECYSQKTATFMILGNVCTPPCGFCSVPRGKTETVSMTRNHVCR